MKLEPSLEENVASLGTRAPRERSSTVTLYTRRCNSHFINTFHALVNRRESNCLTLGYNLSSQIDVWNVIHNKVRNVKIVTRKGVGKKVVAMALNLAEYSCFITRKTDEIIIKTY